VNLLDTGDFYGMGHNELLIRRALKEHRHKALLSVKFGALRGPDTSWLGADARPAAVKNFLAYSLTRLGTDHIDIYRPARLDPSVPIEDTIGAIADMVKAGYVRGIGLSEVGAETVRRAAAVHPIVDLQIEYSLVTRGPEAKIFPALESLGVGVTAYGVLSRGLLSGWKPGKPGDFRSHFPRFSEKNAAENAKVVEALGKLAAAKGTTVTKLVIAWVLAKNENVVPVMGCRTTAQLKDALDALDVVLGADELAEIERAVPPIAGTRYAEEQMRMLDSEK
jgi:aryl-alcohol dehydrogenase-like predicted oxidoreductase